MLMVVYPNSVLDKDDDDDDDYPPLRSTLNS
jgi:hypothetical protein